ncbi:zf-RING_2 domain-containing protein [Cephalotus follicularis]|uniref:Zf-RING_2 domain-containing protein n=1 Tax=Cephalotus follicularis TaxID=3775 RepID=A0A1Q3D708_CEPFO|nr:zf-RING_2 domain-containing protein [Cephalotus follicularis]
MSWNRHYYDTPYPYNSSGSFIEYFEGLTYEHVNFIFDGASNVQESVFPSSHTSFYKFGLSDAGNTSYYDRGNFYAVNDHEPRINEYRRPLENASMMMNQQPVTANREWEGNANATPHVNPAECSRRHHNAHDYQVIWQDNIDPDNMTYEELLELGETVGTQNRGLSQDEISLLPISEYKCGFFSRKKSRSERCVICQMEYKRGVKRISLPCKHVYHTGCGSRWLSINKACPICYTEVFADA